MILPVVFLNFARTGKAKESIKAINVNIKYAPIKSGWYFPAFEELQIRISASMINNRRRDGIQIEVACLKLALKALKKLRAIYPS